jgi:large subunit ribosomal protein L5
MIFDNYTERIKEAYPDFNPHDLPKLDKIILSRCFNQVKAGVGASNIKTSDIMNAAEEEFHIITGQKPILTLAKKSIATFHVREKMPLGLKVTLRGEKMHAFLDRLIHLALPRERDFQGLPLNQFDKSGNYHFGLTEQLLFPELSFEKVKFTKGLNVSIITKSKTPEDSLFLLKTVGFPFKNNLTLP